MNIVVIPIILFLIFVIDLFWITDTGSSIFGCSMDSTRWHISCWQIENTKMMHYI